MEKLAEYLRGLGVKEELDGWKTRLTEEPVTSIEDIPEVRTIPIPPQDEGSSFGDSCPDCEEPTMLYVGYSDTMVGRKYHHDVTVGGFCGRCGYDFVGVTDEHTIELDMFRKLREVVPDAILYDCIHRTEYLRPDLRISSRERELITRESPESALLRIAKTLEPHLAKIAE